MSTVYDYIQDRYNWSVDTRNQDLKLKYIAGNQTFRIKSAAGRILYRHSSGMGTVLEFNDGVVRKVLVLDAKYRSNGVGTFTSAFTNHTLPKCQTKNRSGNWSIVGSINHVTPNECMHITDEVLMTLWGTIDTNTSRYNTDYWLTTEGCAEAQYCRNIIVGGVGCDVPNIQTLMRIYCEAVQLDMLDPTIPQYPTYSLANGIWSESAKKGVRSSSYWDCTGNNIFVRNVHYNGVCHNAYANTTNSNCYVIPVLEL